MSNITGPSFVALQVPDPEHSATFYTDLLGLERAPHAPAGAVVFATSPLPFALRVPTGPLPAPDQRGRGVAIWLSCGDADALHEKLAAAGTPILAPPADGPFGRFFVFRDPDGYVLTIHSTPSSPA